PAGGPRRSVAYAQVGGPAARGAGPRDGRGPWWRGGSAPSAGNRPARVSNPGPALQPAPGGSGTARARERVARRTPRTPGTGPRTRPAGPAAGDRGVVCPRDRDTLEHAQRAPSAPPRRPADRP